MSFANETGVCARVERSAATRESEQAVSSARERESEATPCGIILVNRHFIRSETVCSSIYSAGLLPTLYIPESCKWREARAEFTLLVYRLNFARGWSNAIFASAGKGMGAAAIKLRAEVKSNYKSGGPREAKENIARV